MSLQRGQTLILLQREKKKEIFENLLTMSSVASLAAVTVSTRARGTTVVNQDREEISGINWNSRQQFTVRSCSFVQNSTEISVQEE